jgi:Rv0078B-related antitoxin
MIVLEGFEVVDEEMARVLRAKTGAERLEIAWRMFASARRMLESHLRSENPDWNERQIRAEAVRRLLGRTPRTGRDLASDSGRNGAQAL